MSERKIYQHPVSLLRFVVGTLFSNPLIFYPFLISAFIQIFILEILYFSARFPLSLFFGPIIKTLYGEIFLHYPFHTYLLPKLFQAIQIPIYLFIASFLIGVAIVIIASINNDKKITFKMATKQVWQQYVHLLVASLIMLLIIKSLFFLYSLMIKRALIIQSTSGIFYIIKRIVIDGAPYIHVGVGILITTLFAFVYPIILITKRKVFSALWLNFKYLLNSFWLTFVVVLLPTIFYLPILFLRNHFATLPEGDIFAIRILFMIISIFVMVTIDAIVYTSVTTLYLLKHENK